MCWPPNSVVKRHRKSATTIWVLLVIAFFVYISYIVWDTVDARKNPAASVELKQSPFSFPDVLVCTNFLAGCLSSRQSCLDIMSLALTSQTGFMEVPDEFIPEDDPDVTRVRDAFPQCAVMPLSRLTVNETGVANGDITHFMASFAMFWSDDPSADFDPVEYSIHTQSVSAHFIDIGQDVDQIDGAVVNVLLPYERVLPVTESWFSTTSNHMVISMAEFSGITETGTRKERERTYSQSTTSSKQNWYWADESFTTTISLLEVEMLITKFEYTAVAEVDPVDLWAIIGAIGGVWQFVAVAFGVFFVLAEKPPPDKKMRTFHDTVITPAVTVNKHLSSMTSSTSSQQDTELDATGEDLPPGWVKKQRHSGLVYYCHTSTGSASMSAPYEMQRPSAGTDATAPNRRPSTMRRMFRGAYDRQDSETGSAQGYTNGRDDSGSLPPGWSARADQDGNVYYFNNVSKIKQVTRPVWRGVSSSGSGVQAVDTPMRRSRRGLTNNIPQPSVPSGPIPSTITAAAGGAVDNPLPPNWQIRVCTDGKSCFSNSVTRETTWDTPK